eukprot:2252610-Amphidinium_carterae.1
MPFRRLLGEAAVVLDPSWRLPTKSSEKSWSCQSEGPLPGSQHRSTSSTKRRLDVAEESTA